MDNNRYIRRRSDRYWQPRPLWLWLLLGALVAIADIHILVLAWQLLM